jgi:hypothetical protein
MCSSRMLCVNHAHASRPKPVVASALACRSRERGSHVALVDLSQFARPVSLDHL